MLSKRLIPPAANAFRLLSARTFSTPPLTYYMSNSWKLQQQICQHTIIHRRLPFHHRGLQTLKLCEFQSRPIPLCSRDRHICASQRKKTSSTVSVSRLPIVVVTTTLLTKCGQVSNSRAKIVVLTAVGIAACMTPTRSARSLSPRK